MRIGNWELSFGRVRSQTSDATIKEPTARPNAKKVVYGKVSRPGGTLEWNDPEFDFKVIAQCLATESFFRRAVDKYVELIWRNGYQIRGNNDKTVKYTKERFRQIAMVTGIKTDVFLRSLSQQVVTYHNSFIEKVRNIKASGGRPRVTFDGRNLKPVAGYFTVDATSMRIAKMPNGKIRKYRQEIKDRQKSPEWVPDDMIHVHKDREAGLTFGTPMVAPVIDDIRALRRIEENIEILIFQHAIPLHQYLVGDEDNQPTELEITTAQNNIRNKPTEGMLITPYYHQIKAIGSEGRALRCEGYLDYFKNRIFAGLGTSEVAMGYSGSASRSAADTLERSMYNTVREYQNVLRIFIEEDIFAELLAEGGYPWDDDNKVEFFFPEIDLDDKIKLENHISLLYSGNLITESEARAATGRDPLLPEERPELHFNLIELPRWLVTSIDEPFLATFGSGPVRKLLSKNLAGGSGGERLVKSLNMPSNQHGTKMSPGTTKDSAPIAILLEAMGTPEGSTDVVSVEDVTTARAKELLKELDHQTYNATLQHYYDLARLDANRMITDRFVNGEMENGEPVIELLSDYDKGSLDMIMQLTKEQMLKHSGPFILNAFTLGVQSACRQAGVMSTTLEFSTERDYLRRKNDEWLSRVMVSVKDASELIMRTTIYKTDAVANMTSVFESNEFRIRLGARNELQRSYNVGTFSGGMALGYEEFQIVNIAYDQDGRCQVHKDATYNIDRITDLDSIPPGYMTHPLCTCTIKLVR